MFLLVFALCLTVILIIVAMMVDLGQARSSKRSEQQLADLASISAGRELAGYGATSGGIVVSRPRDACLAAMRSIRTNTSDFAPTDGQITTGCNVLPVTTSGCNGSTLPTNASVLHAPWVATVRWPIPSSEIEDNRFLDKTGVDDGTEDDRCERMRVAVQRTDDTSFAGVIGVGDLTTVASAVIRSTLDSDSKVIPAFLLLERAKCDVLSNSASGGDSLGIQVLGIPATDQPGTIHVDSTADSGCGGNAANSVAVYGTPLSTGAPSINLHPAPSDPSGKGLLYTVTSTNPAKSVPDGVYADVQPGTSVVSRAPLDEEFNTGVTELHARARTALGETVTSGVLGDGWRRLGCDLNPLDALDNDPAPNWYVRCDSFSTTSGAIDAAATSLGTPSRIVIDGDLTVGNGQTMTFATTAAGDVSEVTVKGKVSTAGSLVLGTRIEKFYVGGIAYSAGANASSLVVTNNGSLRMRASSLPTLAPDGSMNAVCPLPAQASGRGELVVFGDDAPNFNSAGPMTLCNTVVYLAGNTLTSAHVKQSTVSGGNCTTDLPCPKTTGNAANAGNFEFNGLVDWTAPNATSGAPPSPRGVEDLLFWSESGATTDVKSGAKVLTQGVFVAPNMNVVFRSPTVGSPRNAQFISRRLELLQGTLYMLPKPNDSTPIPSPGSFIFIR